MSDSVFALMQSRPFSSARLIFRLIIPFFLALSSSVAGASPATSKELLTAGRVDEAIASLENDIAKSPSDADAQNLLCRAYFMLDEWDRAIGACERARSLDPQRGRYHLWLGRAYGGKAEHAGFMSAAGLAKKVRGSFERAVELDPKDWEARADLADFYLDAPGIVGGGRDKAQAQADALMALNAGMGHLLQARIAAKGKDAATAEREYRAAIDASHSGARAWFELGYFLFHANRLDEMEQAFRKVESAAAERAPGDRIPTDRSDALRDAASVLLRANRDLPLAVRLLRKYLASPVEEAPAFKAHDLLGQILEKQGDRAGAAEEFRAALGMVHGYARAQEDLKRVAR